MKTQIMENGFLKVNPDSGFDFQILNLGSPTTLSLSLYLCKGSHKPHTNLFTSFKFQKSTFLDAIASPSTYPCLSVGQ